MQNKNFPCIISNYFLRTKKYNIQSFLSENTRNIQMNEINMTKPNLNINAFT